MSRTEESVSAHVWVIEEFVGGKWVVEIDPRAYRTRREAENGVEFLVEHMLYAPMDLRIRKYERKDK